MNLRPRLTYANVVSSLCLFILLGGSAYAVTQIDPNSVGTKQLKKNAVKTGKIADRTIRRVDARQGAFATPPQLAGKLGVNATAKNAAKLGNIPPFGFMRGNGDAISGEFDVTSDGDVLEIAAGGQITIDCGASGHGVFFTTNANSWDLFQWSYVDNDGQPNVAHVTRQPNQVLPFVPTKQEAVYHFDAKSSVGPAASLTVFIRYDDATDHCIGRYRGFTYG